MTRALLLSTYVKFINLFPEIKSQIQVSLFWIVVPYTVLYVFMNICLFLFEGTVHRTFTSFFKDKKVMKKSQNSRNQGFSSFFCFFMEGSGSGAGSVQINYGSGCWSRWPQNIRIRMRNNAWIVGIFVLSETVDRKFYK
jgi:hypothetical protein